MSSPSFHPAHLPRLQAEADALRVSLEMLVHGDPLPRLLERLCLLLEPLLDEGRCSILTLDAVGLRVRHGAGPSLPMAYLKLIDGLPIGPVAGSCGTAMWHKREVVVEDIAADPLWEPYRAAALPFGLHACASVPILDRSGGALGSFAIYHDHAGPFSKEDLALLKRFTAVAALAIEGHDRERRLHDSEARYHALVAQSADAIFLFDPETKLIQEANAPFCDLMGYTEDEIRQLTLFDLVAHERASVEENIRRTLVSRRRSIGERMYRRKDGSLVAMEVSASVVDLGGRPFFSVIGRDITDRRAVEEALRLSERRFRDLFDASPVPLALTRASDGVVLEANASAMHLFGVDERVIGTPFALRAYLKAEDRTRFLEVLRQEGSLRDYEANLITARGPSQLLVSARIIPWEDGEAILLGYTDITERRRHEEALQKSEATFRLLFDTTPAALVLSRPSDGTILLANPAAYRLFELTPEEVVHHRTVEFFADPESRVRLLHLLSTEGRAQDFGLEMIVHGHHRQVVLQGVILHYQGEPAIMVAITDLTARQREEEALRQAQKLESLGVLAGGIAHDFNNLLTAILGNLNLAQLHLAEDDAAMPYLNDMEAVVQRAADLARQMLAYSGKGRFRFEKVDLNRMVREMTQLLAVSVSKKVQLHLDLEPGLSGVEGDPVQLQQVLMNLVTNASEAIGDREGAIRLHTGLETLLTKDLRALRLGQELPPGEYLCLEVEDTGVGMNSDTLARLFDPFFTTKATGRGLGLSAMLGILRGHHAGLAIRSEPGQGTRFRLYFAPVGPLDDLQDDAIPSTEGRMQGRVLVVDDEAPVRLSAAHMLTHFGLEVEEAEDGEAGVAKVRQDPTRWACVLLDLTMPRMDGLEALRRIRALRPDLPVILSSGFSDQASALPLDGPGTFLPKPYRMDELRAALAAVLDV